MDTNTILTTAQEILDSLSHSMFLDCNHTVEVQEQDDYYVVNVNFEGDDLGYLIGPAGGHLRSLQAITKLMIMTKLPELKEQMDEGKRLVVNVDAGGYMKQREDRMIENVKGRIEDARALGESVDLEPMRAAQRRVIHSYISQFDDVETESVGEEPQRFIRIKPAK